MPFYVTRRRSNKDGSDDFERVDNLVGMSVYVRIIIRYKYFHFNPNQIATANGISIPAPKHNCTVFLSASNIREKWYQEAVVEKW